MNGIYSLVQHFNGMEYGITPVHLLDWLDNIDKPVSGFIVRIGHLLLSDDEEVIERKVLRSSDAFAFLQEHGLPEPMAYSLIMNVVQDVSAKRTHVPVMLINGLSDYFPDQDEDSGSYPPDFSMN